MIFLFSTSISAQNEKGKSKKDTTEKVPVDSSIIKHSPRKATIFSAVLPGLGQVYNKKYWKLPILYGGIGVLFYFIKTNNDEYQIYKNQFQVLNDTANHAAYNSMVSLLMQTYNSNNVAAISTTVLSARDYYRHNRDLCYIISGIVYILNIVDADVDAHLFYFDVSDKLTLNWKPTFYQATNFKNYPGLSLKLNF
jgi:uncharacterized protein DUF5683